MEFKVGDKVICIDAKSREEDLTRGAVYTISSVKTGINAAVFCYLAEAPGAFNFVTSRFLRSDLSDLEKIIYGITS